MTNTDYGHDLLFGAFITPVVRPIMHAVELAQVADRAGLDLVTFQDHPYQPTFHDAWTLLSYVAASTRRIHVSGNVLNLPLRQPAVIARSATSLDLLSSGRFELGIGAGGHWDAIESMGGRRLKPAQSIDALEEAIQIIREIWAAEKPGVVHVDGTYYQVKGVRRGPRPAHNIGIWIGAHRPKILHMLGRVADGWLPTMSYFSGRLAGLEELNNYIDEGAASVGRDPSDIRRLLNITGQFTRSGHGALLKGTPQQWAEQLAELTLTYGITGFILMEDDARAIELFAAEVAPATRELVMTERARR
ncbi:LLM class flavin-dependent oxidoreductase [Dictyobacter formicarum]|uniref:N5,N10-methylene tetrahydromethanopterin reductase n=1 Tax=Dictyobacter formicarum TaxID=2778368 RepID=A0ABQ3VLP2_9CHLR|nr:LLM class flavin-dependent oxidoreductase [Dictyobacter formicarum]GHO87132.1 N5,N10-methylene tetrahydromethanopterin reductase [Dictyobacter formicarum]